MKVSVDHGSAFSPYNSKTVRASPVYIAPGLPDMCIVCVDMARDTPGSPMSRPRDLAAGGATATLTSGAYHVSTADPQNLHNHALQQKILEVM